MAPKVSSAGSTGGVLLSVRIDADLMDSIDYFAESVLAYPLSRSQFVRLGMQYYIDELRRGNVSIIEARKPARRRR